MDNSQFLSNFWGLSDEHSNEQILQSAESIVNLVESKQKFEHDRVADKEKFKLYLNVCENPTEDILYTFKRLIGGIASTGVNARRGFTLTYSLLLEKFSDVINFHEMINIIEKETIVSKSEKNHIKSCALTGKVLLYKSLLDLKNLSPENILTIFRILFELIQNKILEEAILQIFNEFLQKVHENFYYDLHDTKKINRFLDKFLNLLNKILVNKTNFENMKNLYEFSLVFILLANTHFSNSIQNFLHTNTLQNIISVNSLLNYFKLILSHSMRDNEFHVSFRYFLNLLKGLNDFPKVIEVWNTLIENDIQVQLKKVSLKNFQFLIFSFSKFILENYFILKYIKQIFDSSFFDTLLKFPSSKKFKFINSLIETLMNNLKIQEESEKENVSSYSLDLLSIFGSEGQLSPQSHKNFFTFLFCNLDETQKMDYIHNLSNLKLFVEEEMREEEIEVEDLMFRVSAFKQLMISGEVNLGKNLKNKILEFFLREYLKPDETGDVEFEDIIEDRLLLVVFSYMRVNKEITKNDEDESAKTIKDSKMVKLLIQVHKHLQSLIKSKVIEDIEMEDYKIYTKYFKKLTQLVSNEKAENEKEKEKLDKIYSIVKIGLISLILFLKNPNEYSDILSDLLQVSEFKEDYEKVYMDLIISLLHKGNNTLSDFLLNCFRKISKYLTMDSIQVLIDFLTQTKNDKEELDESIDETNEEEELENGKVSKVQKKVTNKKSNGNVPKKMFDDLVEKTNEDVEMSDS